MGDFVWAVLCGQSLVDRSFVWAVFGGRFWVRILYERFLVVILYRRFLVGGFVWASLEGELSGQAYLRERA